MSGVVYPRSPGTGCAELLRPALLDSLLLLFLPPVGPVLCKLLSLALLGLDTKAKIQLSLENILDTNAKSKNYCCHSLHSFKA
jgi:hypothetical protein